MKVAAPLAVSARILGAIRAGDEFTYGNETRQISGNYRDIFEKFSKELLEDFGELLAQA